MTTFTTPERPGQAARPTAEDDLRPTPRFAQWWSSWRVAVRMARRDARRHKGRSALIATMVALPVLVLVGGATVFASADLDEREQLPFTLGGAAASLFYRPGASEVVQEPTGNLNSYGATDRPAQDLPGEGLGTARRLGVVTGGSATEVTNAVALVRIDDRTRRLDYLGIDGRSFPRAGERARLASGRWPVSADEVLVTEAGARGGLPTSGLVRLTIEGGEGGARDVRVVGTAQGYVRKGSQVAPADIIGLPTRVASSSTPGAEYLLARDTPVTFAEVERLNTYGIQVVSRAVVEDPPSADDIPAKSSSVLPSEPRRDVQWAGLAGMAGVALLLLTSLLAGPAFAVSAARQRRTLALAASNGAERKQLRRTVLGQALVLGVGATAAALVAGLLSAWVVVGQLRSSRPDTYLGPFDIPWLAVSVIVLAAVVSSVVSALLPSRGLGRLDIVGVLRGQSMSPRLRRRVPLAGLVIAALGAGGTLSAAALKSPNAMAAGSAALVVGTLLIVPLLLVWFGRLTSRAPVVVRMATRDAARQRGRATPTVAAVLAGAAVLSTILVFIASDTALKDRFYTPSAVSGHGRVVPGDASSGLVVATVSAAAPEVRATPVVRVVPPSPAQTPGRPDLEPQLVALGSGCTPQDWVASSFSGPSDGGSCLSLSATPMGVGFAAIVVADPVYLGDLLDLDGAQRDALSHGSLLVVDGRGEPPREIRLDESAWTSMPGSATVDIVNGTVRFARFEVAMATDGPRVTGTPVESAATAVAVSRAAFARAFPGQDVGAVMAPETAKALSFPVDLSDVALDAGGRAITEDEERAIADALARVAPEAQVYVERGFRQDAAATTIVLSVIGIVAFIILVATLIATALSQAESQSMSGTLAAVGATRRTRRNLAAAQAGSLALLGAALGVLIGVVPGIAIAWTNSTMYWQARAAGLREPIIVVPWLQLAAPVVVVPFLAAALAWVSIRRAPTVTRRLT